MNKLSIVSALCFIGIYSVIAGCHDEEPVEDALDPYVENPAYNLLVSTGALYTFTFSSLIEDSNDIRNDIMVLNFDNFTPPSTNIEPRPDDVQTTNDLGWKQSAWDEANRIWAVPSSPKSSSPYNKVRQYRLLNADTNNLDAAITTLNNPTYEAINKNIYERQLGAVFVWDFGNYTQSKGENVSNKKMTDYETFYGFSLLPNVNKWGVTYTTHLNRRFSTNAIIYGATYSVAKDTLTVESVYDNGSYSLTKTKFGTGEADIETALLSYPQGSSRLEYGFTLNYTQNNKIYMSFDTASNIAYLYPTSTSSVEFSVPYTLHSNPDYVEINTSSLTESGRIILNNLPTYFYPIITGPFTENGSLSSDPSQKSFFYGKHYVKTDALSRLKLQPVFMFNPTAKADIENAFKQWRLDRHFDEGM